MPTPWRLGTTLGVLVAILVLAPASPVAQGQQPAKLVKLGYLSHSSGIGENEEALRQGLREIGYVEGRNLAIDGALRRATLVSIRNWQRSS
jgi:hypothetical protein